MFSIHSLSITSVGVRSADCYGVGHGAVPEGSEAEPAAEDLLHDLVGAAADRAEPGVAERPLDPVLAHVAVAAEDLDDLVGDLDAARWVNSFA